MTSASEMEVQTVAICAGSGGSMLLGHDADVYFTGEMAHVSNKSLPSSHNALTRTRWPPSQHEILAAVAAGKVVVLCKSTFILRIEYLRESLWDADICILHIAFLPRWSHQHRTRVPSRPRIAASRGASPTTRHRRVRSLRGCG